MKPFAIDRDGGELTARQLPGAGDVVVAIAAASVNPIDFKLRDGELSRTCVDVANGALLGLAAPARLSLQLSSAG